MCGYQLDGFGGVNIFNASKASRLNDKTPFVVITSTNTDRNIREILENGIQHYLVSPVSPVEICDKINLVSDPRKLRKQERFNIPNIRVTVHMESGDTKANVINLTKNSLLCELDYQEDFIDLLQSTYLTVKFPSEYQYAIVREIWCKVLKVNITSWDKNHMAQGIQIVWQFLEIPKEEQAMWDQTLVQVALDYKKMSSMAL